jgi:hypothetical protein
MTFCTLMGDEVPRLSRRKCQKMAPSWSGFFGAPICLIKVMLEVENASSSRSGRVASGWLDGSAGERPGRHGGVGPDMVRACLPLGGVRYGHRVLQLTGAG